MARLLAPGTDRVGHDFFPVLTGAGASAALDFPMMARAVHLFEEYIRNLPAGPQSEASRRGRLKHYKHWIEEEMRNLGQKSDLETLLVAIDLHIAYLERGAVHGLARRVLGDFDPMRLVANDSRSPLEALEDLRLAYMEFVHKEYGRPLSEEARSLATAAFNGLTNSLSPHSISIFTTNYDTVAEAVPAMLGTERLDGFEVKVPEGPEVWNGERFGQPYSALGVTPVFYLHGGASWILVGGEVRRYPGLGLVPNQASSVLVYPGRGKDCVGSTLPEPSVLAYGYFTHSMAAWHALVAVGYSFRDGAITAQLDRASAYSGRSIQLCVIAPEESEEVERLFKRGSIRGTFIGARFEEPETWEQELRDWSEHLDPPRPSSRS